LARKGGILDKSVTATAASVVFFLEYNLFDFSEWRKDGFDVILCKIEMDVANV
jgi:hypothetical protein